MKKIITTLLAISFCIVVMAQTKKADRLFNNWEYFEAATLYEKAAVKNPSQDVYFKLGQCYQKMNKYSDALRCYNVVNDSGPYTNPEFYLKYGQILKNNSRYEQAEVAFQKYADMMPSDPRGLSLKASCEPWIKNDAVAAPFTLTNISSVNSEAADISPVLYKDGIVFTSTRSSVEHTKIYNWTGGYYLDLYSAKSGNATNQFKDIAPFNGNNFNQKYHDGPACFSKDFNTIYFSRVTRDLKGEAKKTLGIETIDIWSSTMENEAWAEPKPFAFNNDSFSVATPYINAAGNRLYFASDMPGGRGGTDIYYCNLEGGGWAKPINMGGGVNTVGNEKYPYEDLQGNFYFSSDGYAGPGGLDICEAKFTNGGFEQAAALQPPFNSPTDDYGILYLDNGGNNGYFTSNRSGGKGDDDIYYFFFDSTRVVQAVAIVPAVVPPPVVVQSYPQNVKIHFDFDKFNIRPDAISALDSIVEFMKRDPEVVLELNAYTDSRGTERYNSKLSDNRGESTLKYLVSKGINVKRIKVTGFGYSHLLNRCTIGVVCTDSEHQINRRVEFFFKEDKTYSSTSL